MAVEILCDKELEIFNGLEKVAVSYEKNIDGGEI
jgi:hypothetical protein